MNYLALKDEVVHFDKSRDKGLLPPELCDNGDEIYLWGNLSEDFVKSLKNEIVFAIQMRNKFMHGLEDGKIAIPREEIGGR